jgi:hypothetical protein
MSKEWFPCCLKKILRFQHCVDRVSLLLVLLVAMFGTDPVDNIHAPTASTGSPKASKQRNSPADGESQHKNKPGFNTLLEGHIVPLQQLLKLIMMKEFVTLNSATPSNNYVNTRCSSATASCSDSTLPTPSWAPGFVISMLDTRRAWKKIQLVWTDSWAHSSPQSYWFWLGDKYDWFRNPFGAYNFNNYMNARLCPVDQVFCPPQAPALGFDLAQELQIVPRRKAKSPDRGAYWRSMWWK